MNSSASPPEADPLCPAAPADAYFDPERHLYVLSRYTDVQSALREGWLWSVPPRKKQNLKIPDETAQQALRSQVLSALSSSHLSHLQARLERIPVHLPKDTHVDLVAEFADTWCAAAAEIVTGASPEDRQTLLADARIVSAAAAEPTDEDLRQQATHADARLTRYFQGSSTPMAGPTFVALSRTVACLLANGWLALLHHPEELARLRSHPAMIPKATEEILRYSCIPQSVFRCAALPGRLCGLHLDTGDRVVLELASANRDPQYFPDPDRFIADRRGPAHIALGFGPHVCAGGALIRMVVTAATTIFVSRFSGAQLSGPVTWKGGSGYRSPVSLLVT